MYHSVKLLTVVSRRDQVRPKSLIKKDLDPIKPTHKKPYIYIYLYIYIYIYIIYIYIYIYDCN